MEHELKYHKSLHTLPIANFHEIISRKDYRYLYDMSFFDIENSKEAPKEFAVIFDKMKSELPCYKPELYQTQAEILYYEYKEVENEIQKLINSIDEKIEELKLNSTDKNKKRQAEAKLKKQLEVKDNNIVQSLKERAINIELAFEGKCRMIDVYTMDTISFIFWEQRAIDMVTAKRKAYEKIR